MRLASYLTIFKAQNSKIKKAMKYILSSMLCCFLLNAAVAQKIISKTFPYAKGQLVNLDLKFGQNIKLKGWDKNEVSIKISVDINDNKLNEAFLADFNTSASQIYVNADIDEKMLKNAKCEDCPDSNNVSMWNNKRVCTKIQYEVYLPRKAELKVKTISADIEIADFEGPLEAKNISGFIDVAVPANQKADVLMKSITGECFSDLELAMNNEPRNSGPVGVKIEAKINGGGSRMELETISSNIYLRRKKE
jgi:hypothetical protein